MEKRFLIILFLLVFILFVAQTRRTSINEIVSPQGDGEIEANSVHFDDLEEEIKGEAKWQPMGLGYGDDIDDLPEITAGTVLDLESGEIMWAKNLNQRIAPASLSKLATIMTAIDISPLSNTLTVSNKASGQIPTKLGLKTGEKLSLEEAAKAALLTSANDATETIADSLGHEHGGDVSDFMGLVNLKLSKIGAKQSHFETATGLDSANHFSTVYDLAIIGHEAVTNYPFIKEFASRDYDRLAANSDHSLFDLPNWNALLGVYPGINGLKIGYTEAAGHSTMVTAERDGKKLLAVLVGAGSIEDRELAAAALLNYGFSKYGIEPYEVSSDDLVKRFEDWRRQLSLAN